MRAFLGLTLRNFAQLIVLICLIGGWSLFNSLLGLRDTISDIATTDREQTLWTATQIEFVLSEFRSDLLSVAYLDDGIAAQQVTTKFDIVYSRVSQVTEDQIQFIIGRHGGGHVAEELIAIRDDMARLIDQPGGPTEADFLAIYDLATEAQALWHPYKFIMLDSARQDRIAKLDGVTDALSNVRAHLVFGLLAAIAASVAVSLSYLMVKRNSVLVERLSTDDLTGCYSRQGFENAMQHHFKDGGSLSIAVIDIDNLKFVNDSFGHAAGDLYIKHVGKAICDVFRKQDCVARVGGDEFWVAADAPIDIVTEKLRLIDEQLKADQAAAGAPQRSGGISFGVVEVARLADLDPAIQSADRSMYEAKRFRKAS